MPDTSTARMTDLHRELMQGLQIYQHLHRALRHYHQRLLCRGANQRQGSEVADGDGAHDEGAGESATPAASACGAVYEVSRSVRRHY